MTDDTVVEPNDTPTDVPADTPNPAPLATDADVADQPAGDTPSSPWGDDWREQIAGENEDDLKTLKRWKDPSNIWKSYKALRQMKDSGELRPAMPDPTDEEAMKEWRVANGIPDTPDAYKEGLDFEISEDDQPLVDKYLADMHAAGATPEQAKRGLESYLAVQQEMAEKRAEEDKEYRSMSEEELRSEWGPEFKAELNGVRNLLKMHGGDDLAALLFTSRGMDGKLLGDNPDVLRFLSRVNNELNPHGTVTPQAGETPVQTIDKEISTIEAEMAKGRQGTYWQDEGMQKRYNELLRMRERYAA